MKKVTIYCDGSGTTAEKPCGFAAILIFGEHHKELSDSKAKGTNNTAELSSAILGLQALKSRCQVTLISDSEYVVGAINEWRYEKWVSKCRQNIPNEELLCELDRLCRFHAVTAEWVKGHSGNPFNERCDVLAGAARLARGGLLAK